MGGGLRAAEPRAGFPEELGTLLGWKDMVRKKPLCCGGGWNLRLSPPGVPDERFVHCLWRTQQILSPLDL